MASHHPRRIVSLDSMVLAWGVRKKGRPEDLEKASNLFSQLEEDEAIIIISSIAAAEYVTQIQTDTERDNALAEISKSPFHIEPFDASDAAKAAGLWSFGKTARQMGKPGSRIALRADTLLVATASNRVRESFIVRTKTALC